MRYFPYLRGRMYDLRGLKALVTNVELAPQIVPLIEPVRDSRELQQTVTALITAQHPFSVVANPQVSVYGLNSEKLYPLPDFSQLPFYYPSAILAPDFSHDFLQTSPGQRSLLIAPNYELLRAYAATNVFQQVSGILVPDEARLRRLAGTKALTLTDPMPLRTTPPCLMLFSRRLIGGKRFRNVGVSVTTALAAVSISIRGCLPAPSPSISSTSQQMAAYASTILFPTATPPCPGKSKNSLKPWPSWPFGRRNICAG